MRKLHPVTSALRSLTSVSASGKSDASIARSSLSQAHMPTIGSSISTGVCSTSRIFCRLTRAKHSRQEDYWVDKTGGVTEDER